MRRLVDAAFERGTHEIAWHGTDDDGAVIAAGLYIYRVEMDGTVREGHARQVAEAPPLKTIPRRGG